jgi:antitoxin PrlF
VCHRSLFKALPRILFDAIGNAIALTGQCVCITIMNKMFESENAMSSTLEVESTLTDRYQTTVPETVRRALRLGKRDKIHYTIRPSGEVVLTRATNSEDDPVLGQFLNFLAHDIASHPERLQAMDSGLVKRLNSLVNGIEVDLDAALSPDDE